MDHTELSSPVINNGANEYFNKDVFSNAKTKSSDNAAKKSIGSSFHKEGMISIEQLSQNSKCASSDEESALLDDVKVCDICGDAGREDLLAVCSKCGDGAEHIYCMRTVLEKVPDNSWMREECVLSEEEHKVSKDKTEQFVAYGRRNSSNRTCKIEVPSKIPGRRIRAQMNGKTLINKSSSEKVGPPSSHERISGNQISALTGRPKPVGSVRNYLL